ncbi:F-box/LRR protein, putative [Medicago truncatula]|uniref:F-box/LRR protein, putative n=1 Tax=Medicago truncatula TaxID=3880 RepID=G7K630_MEDTR|nr:F-box/LRR protein, putative [Medicago truncatula]
MDENNNRRNLSSLSTVSKRFLSITGRLRFSLTLVNPTPPFLLSLFKRFTHLNFLDLSRYLGNNLDDLLCQISDFPSFKIISLKLPNVGNRFPANGLRAFSQNITTLTSFTCSGFVNLFLIAECFPLLDDLDLRLKYPLNYISMIETRTRSYNNGVEALSLSLHKLRKVNLSSFPINNQSLFHLFSNCKLLQEVNIDGYKQLLTDAGIASALRERPTLMSFSLSSYSISRPPFMTSHIIDSLVSFKGLTCLGLYYFNISDELLYTIARGGLPLIKLVLKNRWGYSYDGLFCLLSKCRRQGFRHLYIGLSKFLNDQHVIQLSSFLGDLMSINLSNCDKLTESSLFALARNCPLLEAMVSNIPYMANSLFSPSEENVRHKGTG